MNKRVVIFGIQDFAELAWYYLMHDSKYEVVAFSVNEEYIPHSRTFHGLPVVPFEMVECIYSPEDYLFFAPMSPKGMNKIRERIYWEIKRKGYRFISYISSRATVFENSIGENCFILEDNTIQPFAKVGDNVVLWSGNHIGHHTEVKDHVSITSHVVVSGHCILESYSFFGVNCTIKDWIIIAEGSLIAMAASVIKNTEPWCVYMGNPAKLYEGKSSIDLI